MSNKNKEHKEMQRELSALSTLHSLDTDAIALSFIKKQALAVVPHIKYWLDAGDYHRLIFTIDDCSFSKEPAKEVSAMLQRVCNDAYASDSAEPYQENPVRTASLAIATLFMATTGHPDPSWCAAECARYAARTRGIELATLSSELDSIIVANLVKYAERRSHLASVQ